MKIEDFKKLAENEILNATVIVFKDQTSEKTVLCGFVQECPSCIVQSTNEKELIRDVKSSYSFVSKYMKEKNDIRLPALNIIETKYVSIEEFLK